MLFPLLLMIASPPLCPKVSILNQGRNGEDGNKRATHGRLGTAIDHGNSADIIYFADVETSRFECTLLKKTAVLAVVCCQWSPLACLLC
jgi:hypothetical protein